MTLRRLKKLQQKEEYGAACSDQALYTASRTETCQPTDTYHTVDMYKALVVSGGTFPRFRKKGCSPIKWKTVTHSPEQQRKIITLHKEDGEPFGFEIQTYGVHHHDENSVEMLTFVCNVHKNSIAELSGLKQGDTIVGINGINVDGLRHKEIVEIIKSCSRFVRLETIYGTAIRKAELETRLQYLKQTLHEKYDEYRTLIVQEQRLVHGIVMTDPSIYDTLESVQAYIYGQGFLPSPAPQREALCRRSTCSSTSYMSTATDESDDPLYHTCIFDSTEEKHSIHNKDSHVSLNKPTLGRSASLRITQNGADYRSWDRSCEQNHFGTLPLKSKQKSLRKRLLKFIPGLNKSLEEEESQL